MQEIHFGSYRASLAQQIGKGGEGSVYSISGHADLAVKIYEPNLRPAREGKVRAMVDGDIAQRTDLVAFPKDVVTDRSGNFLGFAMRLISGYRPIHELYGPKSRQRHFPKADYRFLVHAAANVARAVGKVHSAGCVIGDLNHSGILVAEDATVALIDADSFQFNLGSKSYPCVVGVPDFTPPELHGKDLSKIQRLEAHDNFGLAVAIFHLLFMGRHPYAGLCAGPDISLGDAIAQNRFAFSIGRKSATKTSPPPGSLTLDMFPSAVSRNFEQAFGLTAIERPSASQWIEVLKNFELSLKRCSSVITHFYSGTVASCSWCQLAAKSRFDMFPYSGVIAPTLAADPSGTEEAIKEILSFRLPRAAELIPTLGGKTLPSRAVGFARREMRNKKLVGWGIFAGAAAGLFAVQPLWFIWITIGILGLLRANNASLDTKSLETTFKEADDRVHTELNLLLQTIELPAAINVYGELISAISAYKKHDQIVKRELMILKSKREARQRSTFLDRHSIRDANIKNLSPAKVASLISFGIETADDVRQSDVRSVPGIGEVYTRRLLDWRKHIEAQFNYNRTPNSQDILDEAALQARLAAEKTTVEAKLRGGLTTLRRITMRLKALPTNVQIGQPLFKALDDRAQAEFDLRALRATAPPSRVEVEFRLPRPPTTAPPNSSYRTAIGGASASAAQRTQSCPRCGKHMIKRTAKRGRNPGSQFWGCSSYPRCKGTRNL